MKLSGKIIEFKWSVALISICFLLLTFFLLHSFTGYFPICKKSAYISDNKTISVCRQLMDTTLADGFDFPFGNGDGGGSYKDIKTGKKYSGWYIATGTAVKYELGIHTGEDWNGNGKGNTDFGQPVYATAHGKVIAATDYGSPWGNVILIEHRYAENGSIKTVYSLYAHLNELKVKQGEAVKRRQMVGTIGDGHGAYPAHLHFELRKESMKNFSVTYWPSSEGKDIAWVKDHYYCPSAFLKEHRQLKRPSDYSKILIAVKHEYKMYVYSRGKLKSTYEISLSQNPLGHKEKQGDNRLPEGEYRITEKSRGPFGGDYAAYFGPAWMRLSYPNNFDAEVAHTKKIISTKEYQAIVAANNSGKQPSKNTALGGGIGIHGWNGDWPAYARDLTWGCISMKNKELDKFYETVPVQTHILILP